LLRLSKSRNDWDLTSGLKRCQVHLDGRIKRGRLSILRNVYFLCQRVSRVLDMRKVSKHLRIRFCMVDDWDDVHEMAKLNSSISDRHHV